MIGTTTWLFYLLVFGLIALAFATWLQRKPMTIPELCEAADEEAGMKWPLDPHEQVAWAMRMIDSRPGTPSSVEDIINRRIWCALANFHRRPTEPEYVPMVCALQRAVEHLEREAERFEPDDYDSTFPMDDAELIKQAIEIVRSHTPMLDLDRMGWEAIKEAASQSKWIPPQYYANDWQADVRDFLINGPTVDEDGSRWRALLAGRVRVIGSAGLYDNTRCTPGYAHIGLELWTQHTAGENEPTNAVELLTKYADIGRQGAKS